MFPTNFFQDSDGEKSDQDLVVDIANETVSFKHKNTRAHTERSKINYIQIKLTHNDLERCTY